MHFLHVVAVALIGFTVLCNGQFKIIGLLDTKSDIDNGKVEKIRSLDEVAEPFPLYMNESKELPGVIISEKINGSETFDGNSKENVNLIKSYESYKSVTNALKRDSMQVTSATGDLLKNNTAKGTESDGTNSDTVSDKNITISKDDDDVKAILELTTSSTTTTIAGTKSYRSEYFRFLLSLLHVEYFIYTAR